VRVAILCSFRAVEVYPSVIGTTRYPTTIARGVARQFGGIRGCRSGNDVLNGTEGTRLVVKQLPW
jgi:hypothetical protein